MFISKEKKLTFSHHFLEPENVSHRQYEALRAYFVDGLPSAQAAARFGYTPGSIDDLYYWPLDLAAEGGEKYRPLYPEPASERPGGRTLGQWSAAEKNRISHRARAAARMAPILEALGY